MNKLYFAILFWAILLSPALIMWIITKLTKNERILVRAEKICDVLFKVILWTFFISFFIYVAVLLIAMFNFIFD